MQGHHRVAARRVPEGMLQGVAAGSDTSMLVPVEAAAGYGCRVTRVGVSDRQMQGHHGVAAIGGTSDIGVGRCIRACGIGYSVEPSKAVADGLIVDTVCGIVHRQMQGHHRVAARGVGESMRQVIAAGGDTGVLVPVEAAAGEGCRVTRVVVSDSQVQGYHRIAARGVGEGMRQVVAAGGDVGVLVPVEAAAGEGCRVARVVVADSQVQGHHGVAARGVGEGMRQVVAAGSDVGVFVPVEAAAGEGCRVACVGMADRQVQGHHRVTARGVGEGMRQVVAAGSDAGVFVPVEAAAGEGCRVTRVGMADRQVQGHHGVAARGVGEGMCQIVAAGGDTGVLVPVEAVAGEGCCVTCVGVANGQVQGHHGVAARRIPEGMFQGVAAGGDAGVLVPVEAAASEGCRVARTAVVNRQVQGHHGVAA